jgi:hypothetical protein
VIPRNAGGFHVESDIVDSGRVEVSVRREGDAAPLSVAFEDGFVRLPGDLAEGDQLAVVIRDECSELPIEARLRVGPAAEPPIALGGLRVSAQREGALRWFDTEGCFVDETIEPYGVYRVVELDTDASMHPWLGLVRTVARVDGLAGVAIDRTEPRGAPRFVVYARCDGGPEGTTPGEHRVTLEAHDEALGIALSTAAQDVSLRCTETALAQVERDRAAEERRARWRRAERALSETFPYWFGGSITLAVVALLRSIRRRKPKWPPDGD